ncbi:TonB-dependent receptor [Asticcacaulis solisilvae]|uniref:TonB-dependent receptor n=1 Tax=Asticcacaulis solisilvae TaxID=1217274 RepID=UPI003FD87D4F
MLTALAIGLAVSAAVPDDTVVVTTRKHPESLLAVPQSVTVFSHRTIDDLGIRAFSDFATQTPNLSFAYGNGATAVGDARTLAIRGVSGAGTTAVYIDQTPVPGSIDPRLLDIDHIEVLKGPQGTLYGEGSLGGSVKVISTAPFLMRPSLDLAAEAGATSGGGSPDAGLSFTDNLVWVPGTLATRLVVFGAHDAGFLKRTVDGHRIGDQGAQSAFGLSATTLYHANDRLDLTFRVMAQRQDDYGFPAAFAPLPAFRPLAQLPRAFDIQPKASDRWFMPSFDLAYRGDGWALSSSTSYFERTIHEVEDSSTGTAQFLAAIGTPLNDQPYVWTSRRTRSQISHETRLTFGAAAGLNGIAGVFYSRGHDDFVIPPVSATGLAGADYWPDDLIWLSDIRDTQSNAALFGELYYPVGRFTVTLGARQYWLTQTYHLLADGYLDGGLSDGVPGRNTERGVSPKAALSYQPSDATQIYVSAAKGFRAGGSGQAVIPQCDASLSQLGLSADQAERYGADTVWSYEAGAKHQLSDPNLLVTGAIYHLDWRDIQQSVFLPSCAFIITANAGAAAANGAEFELAGRLGDRLNVRLGMGYEDARITRAGVSGQAAGARVYQIPRWTATASGTYRWPVGGGAAAFVTGDLAYTGDSVSGNGGGSSDLVRPAYAIVNARFGVRWRVSELSLDIRNLTDARVNLGDIGYLGYAQYEAADPAVRRPQVVTLPPLSAVLRFRRSY